MPIHSALILGLTLLALQGAAPLTPDNQPVEPYRIADGVYFVGASDISSFLITTPAGHILIDAGYESTAPQIEANIAKLGVKLAEVKILLNTQAHFDHAAGFARLKQATGAQLMISEADVPVIEGGGRGDFVLTGAQYAFPPVTVDRRLRDGDEVRLGGRTLTARWTPGHTKGCTTWTFDAADRGRTYKAAVLCGLTILDGTRVTGMPSYPTIETDYERTFEVLKRLQPEIFLGAHPSYYGGAEKARRAKANPDGPNPFVDAAGFRSYIEAAEKRFRDQVARERAGKAPFQLIAARSSQTDAAISSGAVVAPGIQRPK
jgi:metallo-beta-lactamase class B